MKKLKILIMFFALLVNATFAQEEPTAAPQIKTFSTNPDNLGALANSVNLFSGDVALPLNLVSLPGKNGLDVNVSISYSSAGLHKSVGTWNLEALTGILGLGWSMDYPKIIVDNKNTGARDDDEFYLVEGGTTNRLVCVSEDVGIKKYKTKNYQFWEIVYHYPYDIYENEKWVITKENGTKYVFGDYENHPTAVQYLIKWDNWIGSSSLINGQENQAMVWNLSEVVDLWGNSVTYKYDNIEQEVGDGTGTLTHTEASYLELITDTFGRTIEFIYDDKGTNEYMEPHTEAGSEPDAYQERYEKRFIDKIEVKNGNDFLSETIFSYNSSNFVDAGTNKEKRLLESITQKNGGGQTLPDIKFSYKTSGNKGALATVTTPSGGVITYTYEPQTIGNSDRDFTMTATSGFSEPLVWNSDDYVVVTWRNGSTIEVWAYEWDGAWIGGKITTISDVPKDGDNQNLFVSLQKDFFALTHNSLTDAVFNWINVTKLYVFTKSEIKKGEWNYINKDYAFITDDKTYSQLATGDKYAAVKLNGDHSYVKGYIKNNAAWVEKTFYDYTSSSKDDFLSISGTSNYLWIHNRDYSTDKINFQYMDELNVWHDSELFSLGVDASAGNYWYSNNFSSVGLLGGKDEQIWTWDDNYNIFTKETIPGLNDLSKVFMNGSHTTIVNNQFPFTSYLLRYNGSDWDKRIPWGDVNQIYSSSYDFAGIYANNNLYNYEYIPRTQSWQNPTLPGGRFPVAGPSYITNYRNGHSDPVYFSFRSPSSSWTSESFSPGLVVNRVLNGKDFFVYQTDSPSKINVKYIKNGVLLTTPETIISEKVYDQDNPSMVSANNVVTYNSTFMENATEIKLRRVVDSSADGDQTQYAVSSIEVDDGYESIYTSYDYFPTKGTMDPSGSIAKYNKVRVRPGTNSGSETTHPFGYTDTYFFNGLDPDDFEKSIPDDQGEGATNAEDNYRLLTGLPYLVEVYEDGDDNNPVSKKENYWYVYSKTINSETGYYARTLRVTEDQDVTTETNFTYSSSNGLVKTKSVNNRGSNNTNETILQTYKYGSEEYTNMDEINFHPVIQTKTFNNSACTGISVTTWASFPGWGAHKTFVSTTTSSADFTAWTGSDPSSGWLKTSEVISRDSDGNVLEVMDVDGIHSVIKYGFDSAIPVASISNTTYNESVVELCQEYRSTSKGNLALNFNEYQNGGSGTVSYSMYDDTTRGKVQKIIVTSVTGSGGVNITVGTPPNNTLPNNKNYVVEFDIKVSSGEVELRSSTAGTGETNLGYVSNSNWEHHSYLWNTGHNGSNSQIWLRSKWNTSGSSATFYIDNVRIYPEDAFASSTNYDPVYLDVVCATNAQGVNTFYEYDNFRRPTKVRNDNLDVLSEASYFLSRENYTNFNASYPNYTEVETPELSGISRAYTDGFGKTRQTISKAPGNKVLVSETLYDELGRGHIQTKPTRINSSSLNYRAGFVNPNDLQTNETLLGEVQSYNGDSYAYSRTEFDSSPLGRVVKTGLPGADFRIESHPTISSFSSNGTEFSGFSSGQYYLSTLIDPNGGESYVMKDRLGNIIAEKSGSVVVEGQTIYPTTKYKYDAYGNLVDIYPPNYNNPPSGMTASDYVISMTYDHLGRLKTQESPDAGEVKYIYDKAGKTRFMMDGNGAAASPYDNILYWKYDALGRTIEEGYISNISWSESTLQNYADNSPTYPTTPSTWRKKYYYGNISNQYNYGKLVKVEVNNDSNTDIEVEETYNYDIDGNVKDKGTRIVDYNNIEKTISYEYDILGNVTRVSYMPIDLTIEDETISGETYYEAADEISVGDNFTVNSTGSLTLKAGTAINLLPGFSVLEGGTLTTLFGGEGSAGADETQVTYAYDKMGRVEQIGTTTDPDFFAAYTYDVNGGMYQEKLNNNGVTRTYTYEKPGWLKQIDDSFFKEELSYTSGGYGGAGYYNGNIAKAVYDLKWSGNNGDFNVLYKYDKLNRLLVADNTLSGKDVGVGNEISYDANGNLKDLVRNSGTNNYTYYSGTNKVQNVDGSGNDYSYDSNGNITAVVNKDLDNFIYDPFTNLTSSIRDISGSVNTFSFSYGANDQRVYKNANFGTYSPLIAYIHGLSDFPLMEKHEIEGEPEVTKLYVYGPTGLIAVNDDEGWFFMLKDHLGSNRVVVNESNNWVANYDFMPYGDIMKSAINTNISYQFTGQELDTETGLHNFRARLYDSDLGMFYAVDPAPIGTSGQGYNPFAYTGNNPIIRVDRDGQFWHIIIGAAIGGIINTITHADQISDGWDFLAAFGTGAAAGALGAATGGASFAAAGGAAMGGGGFLAGFAGGGIGTMFGSTLQSMGNTAFFNDPYPTIDQQLLTVGVGALTGGLINGGTAAYYGRNFWNGNVNLNLSYPSLSVTGNIQQQTPKTSNAQLPKAKIDGLLDDGIHNSQSNLRVIPKSEIPTQLTKKSIIDGYKLTNHAFRKSVLGRGVSSDMISSTLAGAKSTGNIVTEFGTGKFAGNMIRIYQHNGIKVVVDETRRSILSIRPIRGFKLP